LARGFVLASERSAVSALLICRSVVCLSSLIFFVSAVFYFGSAVFEEEKNVETRLFSAPKIVVPHSHAETIRKTSSLVGQLPFETAKLAENLAKLFRQLTIFKGGVTF